MIFLLMSWNLIFLFFSREYCPSEITGKEPLLDHVHQIIFKPLSSKEEAMS